MTKICVTCLGHKYHNATLSSMQLTDAEQQWLDERDRVLRLGLLDGNMPYSDRTVDGTVTGLIPALAETMQQALDITVDMHCYESTEALQTALLQGSVDVIGPVYGDLYLAEQQDYVLTKPIVLDEVVRAISRHLGR